MAKDKNQLKLPLEPPETDCPLVKGCVAPLCPVSPNLKQAVWFPGEPVCRSKMYSELRWLQTQKEIARLRRKQDRGYFTINMLRAIRHVRPDIKGKRE